jgi:hypothetical protein
MGSARFSTHSHPVGLAFGLGSTRFARSCQIGLRACTDLRLRNGTVAFGPADRANGKMEYRHISNRGFGLVGKKNRCPARGSEPSPPPAGRTRVAADSPGCLSALRLSSKGSGSSEVLCAWVAAYWCEAANVGASFAAWGNTERKSSASCGDASVMSWRNNGW